MNEAVNPDGAPPKVIAAKGMRVHNPIMGGGTITAILPPVTVIVLWDRYADMSGRQDSHVHICALQALPSD